MVRTKLIPVPPRSSGKKRDKPVKHIPDRCMAPKPSKGLKKGPIRIRFSWLSASLFRLNFYLNLKKHKVVWDSQTRNLQPHLWPHENIVGFQEKKLKGILEGLSDELRVTADQFHIQTRYGYGGCSDEELQELSDFTDLNELADMVESERADPSMPAIEVVGVLTILDNNESENDGTSLPEEENGPSFRKDSAVEVTSKAAGGACQRVVCS